MRHKKERYAIGQQDFAMLRERDAVYVDKTAYIESLLNSDSQYFFLARPRRFGKSLFLSVLRYFFEGRKDLFDGLYISTTDWKWEKYPVLRLDLNTDRYGDEKQLDVVLDRMFSEWEALYDVKEIYGSLSQRFNAIIKRAHLGTGKPVVVLVDEYDKPLVGNLNELDVFEDFRNQLASLYSNFKSCAEHIKMVFLTGVSRFSKLSVFSDLNNVKDISFSEEFADICGITETELLRYFPEGLNGLANALEISHEEALSKLKANYDGYRFAAKGSDIFNPWSVLNALSDREISHYWSSTGVPTLIAESLRMVNADLEEVFNETVCSVSEIQGLDLLSPTPVALMYQTGYLTIKDYYPAMRQFRLGIPNQEVRHSLLEFLIPYYVRVSKGTTRQVVNDIVRNLYLGRPEEAMRAIQSYFAGIDYKLKMDNENNFHNAFYLLVDLLEIEAHAEVHTSDGSIDIVMKCGKFTYIVELKYDLSAQSALAQIEEKQYGRPYLSETGKLFLIGASFSSKTRCIEDWKVKTLK